MTQILNFGGAGKDLKAIAKTLYQVEVTTADGKQKRVGPATNVQAVHEELAATINIAVAEGKEKNWRDARVVTIAQIAH